MGDQCRAAKLAPFLLQRRDTRGGEGHTKGKNILGLLVSDMALSLFWTLGPGLWKVGDS